MKVKEKFSFFIMIVAVCGASYVYASQPEHRLVQLQPGVGLFTHQNKRSEQEDRYLYERIDNDHVFAIFDGHVGAHGSEYAKNKLPIFFRDAYGTSIEKMKTSLQQIEQSEWTKNEKCGTTAVIACVDHKKQKLCIANVGDSRLLLVKKNGVIGFATKDHKPDSLYEQDRIIKSGGNVIFCDGAWRVDGCLGMSRVIGSRFMKKTGHVIADPDCTEIALTPEHRFLVIASDGLWDGLSNEEVLAYLRIYAGTIHEAGLAWTLGTKAMEKSGDNVTVLVVNLLLLGSQAATPKYERFQHR